VYSADPVALTGKAENLGIGHEHGTHLFCRLGKTLYKEMRCNEGVLFKMDGAKYSGMDGCLISIVW
jgi:hypothetical protein